jgi:HSP20 family protein
VSDPFFDELNPFGKKPEGQLAVDVLETREAIMIRSAIAGIAAEDLEVNVTSDVVTIRGERRPPEQRKDATLHVEECFWGTFSRSIVLPHQVKPDEAEASMKQGVFTLTIPKAHGEMRLKVKETF